MRTTVNFIKVLLILCAIIWFNASAWANERASNFGDSILSLPHLQITGFSGKALNNKSVELSCHASTDGDFAITIERSKNGKSFTEVGGFNTSENHRITMVDNNPVNRTNYYRLKVTDLITGSISYSKLMVVELYNNETISSVSVTPDPVVNDLNVNVQLREKAYIAIRVTDTAGISIFSKKAQASTGMNQYGLEGTGTMKAGNYLLQIVINNAQTLNIPLIKK